MPTLATILEDGQDVDMPALRNYLAWLASAVGTIGMGALVDVIHGTQAELFADLTYDADTVALVYADATDANNDLYVKSGGTGTGTWTNTGALHTIMEGLGQPYVDQAEAQAQISIASYRKVADFAEREAIPLVERSRGMRVLVVEDWRIFEWRLAGDPDGPRADGAPLASDQWVGLASEFDTFNLANGLHVNQLPEANQAGAAAQNTGIDTLAAVRISAFRAAALSDAVNPEIELTWALAGAEPTAQTVAYGGVSFSVPATARSFTPKDWAAVKQLFVVGNSLSDTTDNTTTKWPAVVAADRGVSLYSVARYSSDWRQVYRAGVEPLYLTISGNALPAGGTAASVTLINGVAPDNDPSVNPASFLNTGDANLTTGVSMAGTIVDGAISRHVTVSIPNAASTAYSIVQDAGGAAVTLSGPVLFIPDIAKQMARSDVLIWIGNNYYYSGVPNSYGDHTNPGMWVDMAKLVAGAEGNRVLILPVIPSTDIALSSDPYNAMLAANARTEDFYPDLYARSADGRDLIQYLQDSGNGSPEDNSDIANGWVPRSLRADSVHLNAAGDAVVAAFVEEAFAAQSLPAAVTQDAVFSLTVTGTNPRTDAETEATAVAQAAQAGLAALQARVSALEYPGLSINSLAISPSIAETGSTVSAPALTITRSGATPTAQTLTWPTDSFALGPTDLTATLTGKSFTAATTFTWTATDENAPTGVDNSDSRNVTLSFAHKGHAGTINKTTGLTSAEVNGMSQSWFATSVGRVLNFTTAADGYLWYSQPTAQADPSSFKLGGFTVAPTKTTRSHTTATGQVVDYDDFLLSDFVPTGTSISLEVIA